MPAGIGASGVIGIAFESTRGTYAAPTKFFPLKSESLMFNQGVTPRRVIRGIAGPLGFVKGNGIVEGDIVMEVLADVLPYFLYASRATVVKTGTGPYVYTAKGNANGSPTTGRTLSITIVRNGVVFGYTGCIVGSSTYSLEDGILMVTHKIMGEEEATASAPTPTYSNGLPFGMGTYVLEIDDVADANIGNVNISIEDNATAEYRLTGGTGADVVHWGENTTKITVDRDFITRTQYDKYRAITAEKFELTSTNGDGDIVKFTFPVGVMTTYAIPLSGVGDLVAAKTDIEAGYSATLVSNWEIAVTAATENIT